MAVLKFFLLTLTQKSDLKKKYRVEYHDPTWCGLILKAKQTENCSKSDKKGFNLMDPMQIKKATSSHAVASHAGHQ